MRILRRHSSADRDEGTSYWMSFADLMAALLAVFVLAVVVLALNLGQQQIALEDQQDLMKEQHSEFEAQITDLQSSEQVRATMVEEIRSTLDEQGIEVHISENSSVLSIPSEQLGFDSADHEISPDFEDIALTVGQAVSEAIRTEGRYEHLDTVFVEGHTDDVPHDGLLGTGNWGLSTFRAISLWSLWEDQLPAPHQLSGLYNADGNRLFSVSGYAETRPVSQAQRTESERAANRRIDLRFTIVRPSSEEMQELSDGYQQP